MTSDFAKRMRLRRGQELHTHREWSALLERGRGQKNEVTRGQWVYLENMSHYLGEQNAPVATLAFRENAVDRGQAAWDIFLEWPLVVVKISVKRSMEILTVLTLPGGRLGRSEIITGKGREREVVGRLLPFLEQARPFPAPVPVPFRDEEED